MANNKVVKSDGTIIIDLSQDTVTSSDHIMEGYVGHLADGSQVTGTGKGSGSGGADLGGLANMVDVSTQDYQYAYMLMCMKNGETVGGTITYTSAFKNTEQLILSTGLSVLHGFMMIGTDQEIGINSGTAQSCKFIVVTINSNGTFNVEGISSNIASSSGIRILVNKEQGVLEASFPLNGSLRFDGGDIYYTARYNKNSGYQIIIPNIEYEWLAW